MKKGHYVIIGKNGEEYHYRYYGNALNKYFAIYGVLTSLQHLDTHFLTRNN